MLFHMQRIIQFSGFPLALFMLLAGSNGVHAQTQNRINSINADGANIRIQPSASARVGNSGPLGDTGNAEKATSGLFPVAPTGLGTHSGNQQQSPAPTSMNGAAASSQYKDSGRAKGQNSTGLPEEDAPDFSVPPLPLRATNMQPAAIPKIRWLLFQSSERSANTGQLTCMGWARSINLAKALETEGPFNAAVASASIREDLGIGTYWNNAAEATIIPLASKWDAPIWALAPADAPMDALSALYQFSKNAKGSANIAVSWDAEYLERFQAAWLEGLVKSGDMDGLQAFSWKQKIRKWSANDKSRIDVLEYTVEGGKLKNVQWRTMNLRFSGPNYGCPTS